MTQRMPRLPHDHLLQSMARQFRSRFWFLATFLIGGVLVMGGFVAIVLLIEAKIEHPPATVDDVLLGMLGLGAFFLGGLVLRDLTLARMAHEILLCVNDEYRQTHGPDPAKVAAAARYRGRTLSIRELSPFWRWFVRGALCGGLLLAVGAIVVGKELCVHDFSGQAELLLRCLLLAALGLFWAGAYTLCFAMQRRARSPDPEPPQVAPERHPKHAVHFALVLVSSAMLLAAYIDWDRTTSTFSREEFGNHAGVILMLGLFYVGSTWYDIWKQKREASRRGAEAAGEGERVKSFMVGEDHGS